MHHLPGKTPSEPSTLPLRILIQTHLQLSATIFFCSTQSSLIQVYLTSTDLLTGKGCSVDGDEVRSQHVNFDDTGLPEIALTKDVGAATATAFQRT